MRSQFQTFSKARQHFDRVYGIKAQSWKILVQRVNQIEAVFLYLGFATRSAEK